MYDLIIIGAGPAGMTAGLYAVRREMKTLVIGREVGGQLVWASEIENYPGFKSINSFELIAKMKDQMLSAGVELKETEVEKIEKTPEGDFIVFTARESFQAHSVIIALGLAPRRLAVPGEVEFNGRGVSYCANCDGPLYKGRTVAVIGGGNSALDAAEVLSKIAKQVYLIHRGDSFKAFETLVDEVNSRPNIEIIMQSEIKEIGGANQVKNLKITNIQTKAEREILLDGVFVEVGRIASTDLIEDFADRNEKKQIIVNSRCETKTPGFFAAGDVTDCEFKQITIALGQATIAALGAYQYLQQHKGKVFIAKNY